MGPKGLASISNSGCGYPLPPRRKVPGEGEKRAHELIEIPAYVHANAERLLVPRLHNKDITHSLYLLLSLAWHIPSDSIKRRSERVDD